MKIIKRNAIRCRKCGDVIESTSVHDFKQCSCGAVSVDGGKDYAKYSGNFEDIEPLIEHEEVPSYHVRLVTHYGSKRSFDVEKSRINDIIEIYEEQWDYLKITDEDGEIIYMTKGFEKYDSK